MKNKIIGKFEGKCCDSEVYNNNGMFLNRQLFNNLINSEEYKRAMQNRYYIGFLGHPEDPNCMDFEHACIIMTDMQMQENGSIWGSFDLVDTPVGRIVKAFIDAGVVFGISIRGAGDVDNNGKVDPETFIFRGYDLVTFPAYDDAVPEFREIAASTDIGTISKYKKVCAAIETNLPKITSCEALEIIQSQFDEDSNEFKMIGDRLEEIETISSGSNNVEIALLQQKLDAVTTLYLQQVADNKKLFEENNLLKLSCSKLTASSDRKIRSIDRIMSSQIRDLESALTKSENKCLTLVSANTRLKDQNQQYVSACSDLESRLQNAQAEMRNLRRENRRLDNIVSSSKIQATNEIESLQRQLERVNTNLDKERNSNLIYERKIQSATNTIAARESEIQDLQSKLRETVTANRKLDQNSSNLDAEMETLKQEVISAQQLLGEYQQAYADMCANAVGVSVQGISVTCKTTPDELKNYIYGSTTTSGLMTNPAFVEPEQIERVDDFFDDDGIVSV